MKLLVKVVHLRYESSVWLPVALMVCNQMHLAGDEDIPHDFLSCGYLFYIEKAISLNILNSYNLGFRKPSN